MGCYVSLWNSSQIHSPLLGDKGWHRHRVVYTGPPAFVAGTTTLCHSICKRWLYPPGQGQWIATAGECGQLDTSPKESVVALEQEIVKTTGLVCLSLSLVPPPIPPSAKMKAVFLPWLLWFRRSVWRYHSTAQNSVVFFSYSCTATKIPFLFS